MDPFHVTCETCHARLKIRSESVIGQIHACPRCESMVHIVPPPGWVASTAVAADSSSAAPVEMAPAEVPAAAAGSSLFVWSLSGAAIAIVLVAGLAVVMWPRGETPVPVAVAPASKPAATSDRTTVETPAENPPAESIVSDATDEMVAKKPSDEAPKVDPDEIAAVAPASPELPVEDVAIAAPAATESIEPPIVAPPAPEANDKKPVLKFDPLDFDPSQLSLGGASVAPPAEASGSVANPNAAPVVVERKDELPANEQAAAPAVGDPSVTVRIGPGATDALRPRNVAEHLGLKIESLDLSDVPLTRFADMVSEIGNIAVTIDPGALAMAGLSPRTNVSVQARGTTLDKLLRDVLTKKRLEYVERNGQIVIADPNRDTRRGVDYEVKDLLEPGAKDATELSELMMRFVAPDLWKGGADGGTIRVDGTKLHVDQMNRVQIQILLFCERLRLARGLALKSKYPAERLSIESPYAMLSAKLGKPTTFTFLPWTRLADVVRRWQESTGVMILVDWEALAKEELAPGTPVACSAINRPWDTALDAVFEPLGLAWWAIDGETIQITSRTALGQIERIEFYSVSKERAGGDDLAKDGATRVERDGPSGRLIVLAPPDVHRKLASALDKTSSQRRDEHDAIRTNASPIGTP